MNKQGNTNHPPKPIVGEMGNVGTMSLAEHGLDASIILSGRYLPEIEEGPSFS